MLPLPGLRDRTGPNALLAVPIEAATWPAIAPDPTPPLAWIQPTVARLASSSAGMTCSARSPGAESTAGEAKAPCAVLRDARAKPVVWPSPAHQLVTAAPLAFTATPGSLPGSTWLGIVWTGPNAVPRRRTVWIRGFAEPRDQATTAAPVEEATAGSSASAFAGERNTGRPNRPPGLRTAPTTRSRFVASRRVQTATAVPSGAIETRGREGGLPAAGMSSRPTVCGVPNRPPAGRNAARSALGARREPARHHTTTASPLGVMAADGKTADSPFGVSDAGRLQPAEAAAGDRAAASASAPLAARARRRRKVMAGAYDEARIAWCSAGRGAAPAGLPGRRQRRRPPAPETPATGPGARAPGDRRSRPPPRSPELRHRPGGQVRAIRDGGDPESLAARFGRARHGLRAPAGPAC